MRGLFLILTSFILLPLMMVAQSEQSHYCATDELLLRSFEEDPVLLERFKRMNQDWERYASRDRASNFRSEVQLRVVFHLVSSGDQTPNVNALANALSGLDPEDVTTPLQSAIAFLNHRFAGENEPGLCGEPSPGQISFCLARRDANGITGLGYTVYDHEDVAVPHPYADDATSIAIQNSVSYPTDRYINVYVVESIEGAIAGYATLPSSHGLIDDGIHIEVNRLEETTMIHEMGHYLGLFHTFGICQPGLIGELDSFSTDGTPYNACSCDNDNCLYNGDMVCDTPPNRMNPDELDPDVGNMLDCSSYNTCETDLDSSVSDPLYNLSDEGPDYKTNYMDYSIFEANHFTPGQMSRMCFMVDPILGPRNSLLSLTACDPGCDPECSLDLADFEQQIYGAAYENSLLVGENLTLTPDFGECEFEEYRWTYRDLDFVDGIAIGYAGYESTFSHVFQESSNYQLTIEASDGGYCELESSINIKVLPEGEGCPPNLDLSQGWENWERIAYHDGYLPGSIPDPDNSDPAEFAIVNQELFDADPNFGENGQHLDLPAELSQVLRVGRIVGNGQALPNASAYYASYTFHPTEENSRIKVWFLGARSTTTTPGASNGFLTASTIMPTLYGIEPNIKYSLHNAEDDSVKEIGGTHERNDKSISDRLGFGGYAPATFDYELLNVNTAEVQVAFQQGWNFREYDFSAFACDPESVVTLTFYARTNSNTDGFDHSYGYFGVEHCLPQIADPVEFDFPNVQVNCLPTTNPSVSQSCFDFEIPVPQGMQEPFHYSNLSDWKVFVSNNGVQYQESDGSDWGVVGTDLRLCSSVEPIKYYRLSYSTLCNTYTDVVRVHSAYINNVDMCPDNDFDAGATLPDYEVQTYCPSTGLLPILELTKPCWFGEDDENEAVYQWQIRVGSTWQDLYYEEDLSTAVNSELYQLDASHVYLRQNGNWGQVSDRLEFEACAKFRRVVRIIDPYCGLPVGLASQEISVQNLTPSSKFNPLDIDISDVCGLNDVRMEFKLNNVNSGAQEHSSQPLACNPDLLTQLGIAEGEEIENTLEIKFHLNEVGNEITAIGETSSEDSFTYQSIWPYEEGHLVYYFSNVGEDFGPVFQNGDKIIIEYSGLMFNCPYTFYSRGYDVSVLELEGGDIDHIGDTCFLSDPITIVNDGLVFPATTEEAESDEGLLQSLGYCWEYSYTADFSVPESFVEEEDPLMLSIPAGYFESTATVVYIRRVYKGTTHCPFPVYSNTLEVVNACPEFNCEEYDFSYQIVYNFFTTPNFTLLIEFPITSWTPLGGTVDFGDQSTPVEFDVSENNYVAVLEHGYPSSEDVYYLTIDYVVYNEHLQAEQTCTVTTEVFLEEETGIDCYYLFYEPSEMIITQDGNSIEITFDEYWEPGWLDVVVAPYLNATPLDDQISQTFNVQPEDYTGTVTFPGPGIYDLYITVSDNWYPFECDHTLSYDVYIQCPFRLYGRLWSDGSPNDGIQGSGESGISGVPVGIFEYDAGTYAEVASSTSNLSGMWDFNSNDFVAELDKDYFVLINSEAANLNGLGLTESNVGSDWTDSDFYELSIDGVDYYAYGPIDFSCDEIRYVYDAGFVRDCLPSRYGISGKVWRDNNQNGLQSQDEPGVTGLPISVFEEADGVYETVATTQSGIYGDWIFNNANLSIQEDHQYYVAISDNDVPQQFQLTGLDQGNDSVDSDFSAKIIDGLLYYVYGPIDISCQQMYHDYDAGFHKKCVPKDFHIQGTAWQDTNGDGAQDSDESVVATLPIQVIRYDQSLFSYVDFNYTNGLGDYQFTENDFGLDLSDYFLMVPGQYIPDCMQVTLSNAAADHIDSDFEEIIVYGLPYYLAGPIPFTCSEDTLDFDIGLRPFCIPDQYSIHGSVWADNNEENGMQDEAEQGLPNIPINLTTYDGTNHQIVESTQTDANGNWGLEDDDLQLDPDLSYYILVDPSALPSGLSLTFPNTGPESLDSDLTSVTVGRARYYQYGPIQFNCDTYGYDIDMGLKGECDPERFTVEGRVWFDIDPEDGLQSTGEPAYSNQNIYIASDNGVQLTAEASMTTDATGRWSASEQDFVIQDLDYYVLIPQIMLSSSLELTATDVGSDDSIDNDFSAMEFYGMPCYAYGPIDFTCFQSEYSYDLGLYRVRSRLKSPTDQGDLQELIFAPNPAQSQTRVILPEAVSNQSQVAQVQMYDLFGEPVYSARLSEGTKEHIIHFDERHSTGVYVVEVQLNGQNLRSRLVILKN